MMKRRPSTKDVIVPFRANELSERESCHDGRGERNTEEDGDARAVTKSGVLISDTSLRGLLPEGPVSLTLTCPANGSAPFRYVPSEALRGLLAGGTRPNRPYIITRRLRARGTET